MHVYILKTAVLNIASDTREKEEKKHKKSKGAHERTEVNTLKKALIEICKRGEGVRRGNEGVLIVGFASPAFNSLARIHLYSGARC